VTGRVRTWATVGALLGALAGCGAADPREPPVTPAAEDVDVAVVSPALGGFTDGADGKVLVRADAAQLDHAPVGDAVDDGPDDGTDDAPPTVPGVVVAAGGTADLEVVVTAIPDEPPAVEVCLEVQPLATGGVTGDEVPLTDTAPDGVRELACGRADVPGR
jgi:hypothetical protein